MGYAFWSGIGGLIFVPLAIYGLWVKRCFRQIDAGHHWHGEGPGRKPKWVPPQTYAEHYRDQYAAGKLTLEEFEAIVGELVDTGIDDKPFVAPLYLDTILKELYRPPVPDLPAATPDMGRPSPPSAESIYALKSNVRYPASPRFYTYKDAPPQDR